MQIQWYPGHMHKAQKQIKDSLPGVDLLIEVLDARIPFSSQNPMLKSLRGNKPCIKVLSKSDLADPLLTERWQCYLEQEEGVKTLAVTTEEPDRILKLMDLCRKLVPAKDKSGRTINCMIMGIPNVGKSTLINILAGKIIAKTGNEPAVTKGQQQINLRNGIVLWDTPGVLWANLENKNTGYRLATTGAIKDTAMDNDDVAFFAANYLISAYPNNLKQRYELDPLPQTELELLETIGTSRGTLRAGGRIDLERISKILLTELRGGTLGRVTLETPEMMELELAELEIIRAEKAAKKATKKKGRKQQWRESR